MQEADATPRAEGFELDLMYVQNSWRIAGIGIV